MSSLQVSRRTALGFLGAGSAAVALAACSAGSNNTGGSGSSVENDQNDYSGEVKFDSYDTSAGQYEPGTREEPPKNFPKPTKPEQMGEKSAAGFYAAIGYMVASLQYFTGSNDPEPLLEVAADAQGNKVSADQFQQVIEMRKSQKTWAEDPKMVAILDSPQPQIDGDTYTWQGKLKASNGAFMVLNGQVQDIPEDQREQEQPALFQGTYKGGTWLMQDPTLAAQGQSGPAQNQQQNPNQEPNQNQQEAPQQPQDPTQGSQQSEDPNQQSPQPGSGGSAGEGEGGASAPEGAQ